MNTYRKTVCANLKFKSIVFGVLIFLFFTPNYSNAYLETFADVNQFKTELLNMRLHINNTLGEDAGASVYIPDPVLPHDWDRIVGLSMDYYAGSQDPRRGGFGFGIYLKDFTTPITTELDYPRLLTFPYQIRFSIKPNANNDPIFFGVVTDELFTAIGVIPTPGERFSFADPILTGYTTVPLPPSMLLLCSALIGLVGVRRKFQR